MSLFKHRLAFCLVLASCGDNKPTMSTPDAQPPDGGGGEVCSLELSADALAGGSWDPRFTVAGFTGPDGHAPTVYDFARDTDGSIVAAGEFRYVGGDRVEPLMRWKNGAWQPARSTWELTPPGSGFSAVAIATDGKLALATYDDFGERSGEIWLDDGTGLRKIGAFDGLVRRLAWFGGKLWVAGWLEVHGATELQGLAVWNGTAWAAPPGGSPTGFVYTLVPDGNELLVGGIFDRVGGIAAKSVAAYNGTTWRALSFPEPLAVYTLARGPDNVLYAGGTFGFVADGVGGLMRWTGTAWTLAGGGLGNRAIAGVVTDLALHDNSLYVGGCFYTAGGAEDAPSAVATPNVARYDGTWHALNADSPVIGPWFEERKCGDEGVDSVWDVSTQRLFSTGDRVLLGGSSPGVSGVASQALISYDGTAWHPEASTTGLGISGSIDKIGVSASGCDVWGLAQMTHAAGSPTRAHVVHFTGNGWMPIADSLPDDAFCPTFAVSPAGDVAVSCFVTADNGDPVSRLYKVSGSQLVQVGGDLPSIMSIAYDAENHLWLGGGGKTGFLARLDGEALTMVEQGFDAAINLVDPVNGSDVIVAGYFTKVGSVDANRIARWNGTTWAPLGAGLPASASALAHDGSTVYVSTYDEGSGALLLGAYDGTTWTDLASKASGLTPQSFYNFNAISVIDGAVIAVGTADLDDGSARGALVYRNGTFSGLGGGGVHAILLGGLAVTHDAVWVGGLIAEASNGTTPTPSVGIARYVIAR